MKSQRLLALLNHRLRIQTQDGKTIVGQMIAFDKHMNIVLADCEEFKSTKSNKKSSKTAGSEQVERRTMGLVVLRGEVIVSIVSESGPPPEPSTSTKKRQSASSVLTGSTANFPFKGQTVAPQLSMLSNVQQPMMRPGMPMMPPMIPPQPGMPMIPPVGMMPQQPGMPMMPPMMPPNIPGFFPPNIPGMMPPPPPPTK